MTVTEQDARAAGIGRSALARQYVLRIRSVLSTLRGEYTYKSLIIDALYAILTTLILVVLLVAIRRAAPRVYASIERFRRSRIRSIKIQSLELVSAARIAAMLRQTVRLVRLVITVLLLYFYIPLVFSFFPWTRGFGATLLDYVLNPIRAGGSAVVSYIPNLLVLLVIRRVLLSRHPSGEIHLQRNRAGDYRLARFLSRMGNADVQDRGVAHPGFHAGDHVSVSAGIGFAGISRRIHLPGHPVLPGIYFGYREHRGRSDSDLHASVQSGRSGQDCRYGWRCHVEDAVSHTCANHQECSHYGSEFPGSRQPHYQLQRFGSRPGFDPAHDSYHWLRCAMAAGT